MPVYYSDHIAFSFPLSSGYLFSSVTAGSAKRFLGADVDDHPPPKRLRTGDVVLGIDHLPPTGREWVVSLRVFQTCLFVLQQ